MPEPTGQAEGAAALEDEFRERLGSFAQRGVFQRVLDWLYGYDYFISYKWSDGRVYALALAEQLQQQGFDCFLDSEDYIKGDNWKSVGERALKKTTRVVLVGSPEVHQSFPVLRELKVFTAADKRVIPINFDDSLSGPAGDQSPLAPYLDPEGIWIGESMERLSVGPSASTIEQLEKSFTKERQSQKRTRALRVVASIFVMLIMIAGWYGYRSYRDRIETFNAQTDAMVQKLTSDLVADDVSSEELSKSFANLFAEMSNRQEAIVEALKTRQGEFEPTADDEFDQFAKQRASAAVVLVRFGQFDLAKTFLCELDGRPEPLAQFAARCQEPGGLDRKKLIEFAKYLIDENDSRGDRTFALAAYSALLGMVKYPDQPPLPKAFREQLDKWFREHPSAAIHSACGWLLGREAAEEQNQQLAQPPADLDFGERPREWFVLKFEAGNPRAANPVEYVTFIVFEHNKQVFAISDREATVGLCDMLDPKLGLHWYDPQLPQPSHPVNFAKYDEAMQLCKEVTEFLPATLHARLPTQIEWAVAWGNPQQDNDRVFQFGKDGELLNQYGKVGRSKDGLSILDPVASHRPSEMGMFDMQGNVAEWTSPDSENMRGGAVGQSAETSQWGSPYVGKPATFQGFRMVLSSRGDP